MLPIAGSAHKRIIGFLSITFGRQSETQHARPETHHFQAKAFEADSYDYKAGWRICLTDEVASRLHLQSGLACSVRLSTLTQVGLQGSGYQLLWDSDGHRLHCVARALEFWRLFVGVFMGQDLSGCMAQLCALH